MNNHSEQVFIGSVVALVGAIGGAIATAIINLLLSGKISINYWWVWVVGAILGALLLYTIYQTNRYPFKKFRVTTNREDGKSLLADSLKGKPVEDDAWLFTDCTVYGPYLPIILGKGKYNGPRKLVHRHISCSTRKDFMLPPETDCVTTQNCPDQTWNVSQILDG